MSPDIIAVEEIQDNNGTTNAGVVAADQTYAKLINAIVAAGGPTYTYRQIDPENSTDGGQPVGNIRVGFLFRTDRGLTFIDRPGAGATTANANVIVLGDLNDFQFSAPLAILEDAGLHNLMKDLPPGEQYTYVAHVNAEFAFNNRASDHDPQVVLFTLPPVTDRSASGGGSFAFEPGAFTPDPTLAGKASTGFSLHPGEELKGQLQFSIDGVIDFHAPTIDWAHFSAAGVEFEGLGTADGLGEFRFRADAAAGGKKARDSFRIRLWNETTGEVLFDSGTQTLSGSVQIR